MPLNPENLGKGATISRTLHRNLHGGVLSTEKTTVWFEGKAFTYEERRTEYDSFDFETTEWTTRARGEWCYEAASNCVTLKGKRMARNMMDFKHSADEDAFTSANPERDVAWGVTLDFSAEEGWDQIASQAES